MKQKHFDIGLRASREKDREADFVASTDAVDAHGESIAQNWKLDRYLRNPVVLYGHNAQELPIGVASKIGIEGGQLVCTIRFATAEANPRAELVWQSILQRTLRAVSVGFRPHTIRTEQRDGQDITVLDDNELYEISVVAVPANPDALARAKALAAGASPPAAESLPDLGDLMDGEVGAPEQELIDLLARNDALDHRLAAAARLREDEREALSRGGILALRQLRAQRSGGGDALGAIYAESVSPPSEGQAPDLGDLLTATMENGGLE